MKKARATVLRVSFLGGGQLRYALAEEDTGEITELVAALTDGRCRLTNVEHICVEYESAAYVTYDACHGWQVIDRRRLRHRVCGAQLKLADAVHYAETMHNRPKWWTAPETVL